MAMSKGLPDVSRTKGFVLYQSSVHILQGMKNYARISPISQKIDPAFYENFYEDVEGERELPRIYVED